MNSKVITAYGKAVEIIAAFWPWFFFLAWLDPSATIKKHIIGDFIFCLSYSGLFTWMLIQLRGKNG
jgi:hypothetical protein